MMDTYGMEVFTQWLDDVDLDQSYDKTLDDDLQVTEAKGGLFEFDIADHGNGHSFQHIDVLDILGSPVDELGDPFQYEWMEQGDLLQYLGEPLTAEGKQDTLAQTVNVECGPATPDWSASSDVNQKKKQKPVIPSYEIPDSRFLKASDLDVIKASPPSVTLPISSDTSIPLKVDSQVVSSVSDGILQLDEEASFSADEVESIVSMPSPSTTLQVFSDDQSLKNTDLFKLLSSVTKGQSLRTGPYNKASSTSKSSKCKGRRHTASISPSDLEFEFLNKRDRKKLQNKNAAIRYRMKKKVEADDVKIEEENLQMINNNLKEKVEQLTREVQYMKDLIREVRIAKGLKS